MERRSQKAAQGYQFLLTLAARQGWSGLAARLFSATLERVPDRSNSKFRILALQRPGFQEDSLPITERRDDVSLLLAPQGIMKALASGYLPQTIDDNNYVGHPAEIERRKLAYRTFLAKVLKGLARQRRIDAVISGNFCYFAERELQAAAESQGIPFVVIHKESLKSEGRREFYEDVYRARRGRFEGRRILLYNALERDAQIASGVVDADRATVCGMPRLDRMHEWRQEHRGSPLPARPMILCFVFAPKDGLPRIRRKENGKYLESLSEGLQDLSWQETAMLTLRSLVEFARQHPEVDVVLKAKKKLRQEEAIEQALAGAPAVPDNLKIVIGGDPFELLKRAWAVIGMNSTAILEALATGTPVLSPGFGEAAIPERRAWIADFGAAIDWVDSPELLLEKLRQICSGPPPLIPGTLPEGARQTLEEWVGNSDGNAAERVWAAIEAEIVTLPAATLEQRSGALAGAQGRLAGSDSVA